MKTLVANDVNRTVEHYLDIAGKGVIVSRALLRLGESVRHLTHLGGRFRAFFLAKAAEEKLFVHGVRCAAQIRFCTTLLDAQSGGTTEIVEDGFGVEAGVADRIIKAFRRLLSGANALIISGSMAKGYPDTIFPDMVRLAKKERKFVIADVRGDDLTGVLREKPDVVKPNFNEFVSTFFPRQESDVSEEERQKAVRDKLMELAGREGVKAVLTDGRRNILYTGTDDIKSLAVRAVEAKNTTGCGDVFTAGFASAFLRSRNIDRAVAFGATLATQNACGVRPGFIDPQAVEKNFINGIVSV